MDGVFIKTVENLINNTNYVEMFVVILITIVFLMAVIFNFFTYFKYKSLIKALAQTNYEGIQIYKDKSLNLIVSTYKDACSKAKDFVNTQAIIESKFYSSNVGLISMEKFVNSANSIMITLGVAGAIYGALGISERIGDIFTHAEVAEISEITAIFDAGTVIMSFVSVAFLSVFIAAISCFVFSIISSLNNIQLIRSNFFSRLEDYLDNELGATMTASYKTNEPLVQGKNDNSNILYMLENTSHSMMTSTNKLETTITKLNESILEILGDEARKKFAQSDVDNANFTMQDSKRIINEQFAKKEARNSSFADPIENANKTIIEKNKNDFANTTSTLENQKLNVSNNEVKKIENVAREPLSNGIGTPQNNGVNIPPSNGMGTTQNNGMNVPPSNSFGIPSTGQPVLPTFDMPNNKNF